MRSRRTRGDSADVWLLTITWGGQDYRWSSYPVSPVDGDGEAILHGGGLDLTDWTDEIEILTTSPDSRSVQLELDFPIDVAERIETTGWPLDTATGELALWREGEAYEQRIIVLTGRVSKPDYGAEGEPVAFSLIDQPYDDASLIPAASQRVSATTLSTYTYDDDSEGLYYPIPYGRPGVYYDGTSTAYAPGSPAVIIDRAAGSVVWLLIAGHHAPADSVVIIDGGGLQEAFSTTRTRDDMGQAITLVDVSGAGTIDLTATEFWVAWSGGEAHPMVKGAGSLLLWLLRQSTLRVDDGRAVTEAQRLDWFQVGGYIDEATSPWDHVQDVLLPILPVSIVSGPDGLYPLVWPYDADTRDAVANLVAGPGLVRDGMVQSDRDQTDIANEIRLEYAQDASSGTALRSLVHSGARGSRVSSGYAQVSDRRYGTRAREVSSRIIWTEEAAYRFAATMIRLGSLSLRRVKYDADDWHGTWLRPGMVVLLTDSEIHWSERICIVTSIALRPGRMCGIGLLHMEDPPRDRMTS